MPEGHRRRRRVASLTVASTAASSPQTGDDAVGRMLLPYEHHHQTRRRRTITPRTRQQMGTTESPKAAPIKRAFSSPLTVSSRVKLSPGKGDRFGLCPFHSEKRGSFSVNDAKGLALTKSSDTPTPERSRGASAVDRHAMRSTIAACSISPSSSRKTSSASATGPRPAFDFAMSGGSRKTLAPSAMTANRRHARRVCRAGGSNAVSITSRPVRSARPRGIRDRGAALFGRPRFDVDEIIDDSPIAEPHEDRALPIRPESFEGPDRNAEMRGDFMGGELSGQPWPT